MDLPRHPPPSAPRDLLGIHDADTERRYRLLLAISDSISSPWELPKLLEHLGGLLRQVLEYDFVAVLLNEPETGVTRLLSIESRLPTRLRYDGLEFPTAGTHVEKSFTTQSPIVVADVESEPHLHQNLVVLREHSIRSYVLVPLTTAVRRLGVLAFFSLRPDAYADADVGFVQRVAAQMALAIDNTLNFAHAMRHHRDLADQRDRWRALLEVNNALVTTRDLPQLVQRIAATLCNIVRYDHVVLTLYDEASNELRIAALIPDVPPEDKAALEQVAHIPLEGSAPGLAFTSKQPLLLTAFDPAQFPSPFSHAVHGFGVRSACFVPLLTVDRTLGVLIACAQEEGRFAQRDLDLLVQIGGQVAIAIENAQAFQEISALKDRIASEKIYLEEEIRGEHNFGEIVGESVALGRVLQQVETVAPTESTVLLLGETGTGKELLARAVHDRSGRRSRTLVKVNCAAIPSGLLESELFGHEKGAFTGAIERKVGRFELAHEGTLFLDEVGDIPLELQAKLLRVLQDHEFERLGSTRSIKVDVRIVAATNQPLHQMVANRQFRSDLYYRLNVFPIVLPPLRDRPEDIPRLVHYFVHKFARRMKKPIDTIQSDTMAALCRWSWPGNVRELENIIERAVIQSKGSILQVPLHEFTRASNAPVDHAVTLEEAERDHILKVLHDTDWTIGGPHGAAARLGMKRTTLNSRMLKLGISRKVPRPAARM
ncbi:MAG: sigma 54-interacting transcriptional regulator [Acidobacteria bacterium]|nr:sigma 54-interacting transcriptional regulator [Acidobacteriota bacterium]